MGNHITLTLTLILLFTISGIVAVPITIYTKRLHLVICNGGGMGWTFLLFLSSTVIIMGILYTIINILIIFNILQLESYPGGTVWFSIETDIKAIGGRWKKENSIYHIPDINSDWVIENSIGSYIGEGNDTLTNDEESHICLTGQILIPNNSQLIGKTIDGVIVTDIKFPGISEPTRLKVYPYTKANRFAIKGRHVEFPYSLSITSPTWFRHVVSNCHVEANSFSVWLIAPFILSSILWIGLIAEIIETRLKKLRK